MTGPAEEIGKVAGGVIDAVKGQPVILAMIIFNLLFTVLIYLGSKDFRATQSKLTSMMIELTGESQKLLAQCVGSQNDRRGDLQLDILRVSDPPPRPFEPVKEKHDGG